MSKSLSGAPGPKRNRVEAFQLHQVVRQLHGSMGAAETRAASQSGVETTQCNQREVTSDSRGPCLVDAPTSLRGSPYQARRNQNPHPGGGYFNRPVCW